MASPVAAASSERAPPSHASPHTASTPISAANNSVWAKRSIAQSQSQTASMVLERIDVGVVQTSIPDAVLTDSQPLWTDCIAGYFIDEPPSIAKLHATVNRLWRTKKQTAYLDVQFLNPITAIIRIPNKQSRDWVLEKRVWHIGTTPMIVKQWSPTNARAPLDMTRIPVWVDFMDVPDSLYAEKGLKFLGDIVGKYQKLHPSTEKCLKLDVARVLVEVNFETELIKRIVLTDPAGNITIPVSYPWVPRKCEACQIWGHDLKSCGKSSRKEDQMPKGNENQSESVQGSEKVEKMTAGQASPSAANAANINVLATNSPKLNGAEEEAAQVPEQTQSQVNETQFDAADTEGWEVAKGRKSPRKTMPVHQVATDTTISPNKYRVLQIDDTEDGEIAEEKTNENENSEQVETAEPTQTELNDEDDPSNQVPLDNESNAPAPRNLQINTGGTRGGRGRGRPRKNNNSNYDVHATTNNKSIKASFGKH